MQEQLNIIITGKSGVGKSSFLNYLSGKDFFQTGIGAPVTQQYFESVDYKDENGILYRLYDTKGIEPDTANECRYKINQIIDQRDRLSNIFDWIHTVYYCFAASSKRIEEFEINFIKQLLEKASVIILLTKKDLVSEVEIDQIKRQIKNEIGDKVQVISVCSVSVKTRKAESKPSGRETVLRSSFLGLWNKLSQTRCRKITSLIDSQIDWDSIRYNIPDDNSDVMENTVDEIERKYEKLTILQFLQHISIDNVWNPFMYELMLKQCATNLIAFDVDAICNTNQEIYDRIFMFYQKLNGFYPNIIYSHNSKEELQKIKRYDIDPKIEQVVRLETEMRTAEKDVDGTFLFDGKEKETLERRREQYRQKVKDIATELSSLLKNFEKVYQTELYQYGQNCLRNDQLNNHEKEIASVSDLNRNEFWFYQIYCRLKGIGQHSSDTLEIISETIGISSGDAEKIINFAELEHQKTD